MAVDLLLIPLLHTEYYLRRDYPFVRVLESEVGVQPKRRGVFEHVSGDRFVIDHVLHVISGLIDTQ